MDPSARALCEDRGCALVVAGWSLPVFCLYIQMRIMGIHIMHVELLLHPTVSVILHVVYLLLESC